MTGSPNHEEIRDALSRALESEDLKGSPTLKKILTFVVSEELAGRGDKLKAFSIALDALGKSETFDPQTDPSVRVGVGRLRNALQLYYLNRGQDDPVLITIPKGSYRPKFAIRASVSANEPDIQEATETPPTLARGRKTFFAAIAVGGLAVSLIGVWFIVPLLFRFEANEVARRANNAIKIVVQENADIPLNDTERRQTSQFVGGLRAALSRNDALSIVLPEQVEQQNPPEPVQKGQAIDFSVVGTVRDDTRFRHISIELINNHTKELIWARTHQLGLDTASANSVPYVSRELNTQIFGESIKALEGRDPETLSASQLFVLATWVPGPAKNSLKWEKQRLDLARLAIEKNPGFGPAYSVLADKLAYLGSVDGPSDTSEARRESLAHSTKALELAPGDANAVFNVAQSQWHSGKVKDSIRSMKRVLELNPNHGLARGLLIVIPYTCTVAPDNVLQDAIAFDRSLGPDNPIRWVTLTWLGWLHLNRGEFEQALEAEKRAAQIFQIPYTVMRHAVILNKLGRPEDAAQLIALQKDNWPNLDPAHFSEVTMPKLCGDFPGPHVMLEHYESLTRALSNQADK